ncbi:hypothetical protein [Haloferula rosea]|uniref:protein-tyrosine-phosphatase n=1 Tax=Haloferula rosea TaxID=490093 RepID=A0A934REJ5_9BACT|nr:hypothetical protein [Haloferula rosea]MBK1828208.1 hypothetical protein [Haloferula rosea]
MRIAFICTANVCRSVMAHAILERMARERHLDLEVTSAGILDFTGTPPADNAWITCLRNGTSISKMESLFVGRLDLDGIDRFLAMEIRHRDVLVSTYGVDEQKVQLLGAYDEMDLELEIADPIHQPKAAFQECFERIERCMEGFLAQISEGDQDAALPDPG